MKIASRRSGYVVAAVAVAAMSAAVLTLSTVPASAATCAQIGSRLASQNDAIRQMLRRTGHCMKQIASHSDSIKSRPETEWTSLCNQGRKATYDEISDNRDWMLRACTPRGSSD